MKNKQAFTLEEGKYLGETEAMCHAGDFLISRTLLKDMSETPVHSHENGYVSLVLRGSYREVVGGRSWLRPAGSMAFHPRGGTHRQSAIPDHTAVLNVEIPVRGQSGVELPAVEHLYYDSATFRIAQRIGTHMHQAGSDSGSISSFIQELSRRLDRGISAEAYFEMPAWVREALAFLNEHFSEDLSLDTLSGHVSRHPASISRAFTTYLNAGYQEILHRIRIHHAVGLMRETERNLTDIALSVGYYDHAHFSRTFKAVTGVSPGTLR